MPASGWYYVGPDGQPVGPYDLQAVQGLLSSGTITKDTHMWADGCAEWLAMKEINEMKPLIAVVEELAKASNRGAPKDELEAFQAEISALEAAAAIAGGTSEPGDDDNGGPGTATPEELEFEDDDGTIYVWDKVLRKYMPKDGASGAADDPGYDPELMTFVAEDEVIPTLAAVRAAEAKKPGGQGGGQAGNKRKAPGDPAAAGGDTDGAEPAAAPPGPGAGSNNKKAKKQQKGKANEAATAAEQAGWFELKNNTSVYVAGLPRDVTVEEVSSVFSKFGLIKEDVHTRTPRIKLYKDQHGDLKGDALVTYLKQPSVALAVQLLDGTPFRPDMKANMTVQPAKFEQKGESYIAKPKLTKKEKKALAAQQERLLSWGGCDDKLLAEQATVVIKHMFDPAELASEPGAAAELEAEVLEEATKLGPVEKVRVFATHPEGVVSIRFKTKEGVEACLQRMHGRFFDGRRLTAEMWDGLTNYAVKVKESAEEQEARLEAYARELEAKAEAEKAAGARNGTEAQAADTEMQEGNGS